MLLQFFICWEEAQTKHQIPFLSMILLQMLWVRIVGIRDTWPSFPSEHLEHSSAFFTVVIHVNQQNKYWSKCLNYTPQ